MQSGYQPKRKKKKEQLSVNDLHLPSFYFFGLVSYSFWKFGNIRECLLVVESEV